MPGKAPKISQGSHEKRRVPDKTPKIAAGARRARVFSDKTPEAVPVAQQGGILSQVFSSIDKDHEPDSMQVITLIRNGVSGDSIIRLADLISIPKNDVYNLLNLKARTAQRQVSKNLDADKSGHLMQITRILQRCVEVFEDLEKAKRWLKSPNYALGNQIPLNLLDTTEGIELVRDTLTRIEYGAFA
jgi:putative toxin-antitoxin system antitoxin component (TIGR02293 family)